MTARHGDGSAGDADYGVIRTGYARYRQLEPRIAAMILAALGDARTVLNAGAGAGVVRGLDQLRADLESGAWDARHGHLRSQPEFDGALRLISGWP